MWRCFYGADFIKTEEVVCSTHVEMFLPKVSVRFHCSCLLHACGDVSERRAAGAATQRFAPRMWRCFRGQRRGHPEGAVCSTHVEMFLSFSESLDGPWGFAPRMWRCFHLRDSQHCIRGVCSTHVEMFPWHRPTFPTRSSLLHACGDVSKCQIISPVILLFAPRMWRCFYGDHDEKNNHGVCSTHVEMFPLCIWVRPFTREFAPRMWRCFFKEATPWQRRQVCSTHVEMFLCLL